MNKLKSFAFAASLATAIGTTAFAGENKSSALTIEGAWVRPSIGKSGNSAAYMTISNAGGTADTLISVTTPRANKAQLHTHIRDKDIMRMRHVKDGVTVPAHGTVVLKPGGFHVMLMRLETPIKKGEKIPLTLTFKQAGDVTVQAHVQMKPGMAGHMRQKKAPMHKHK
jgi:copper(I)-binding protein